MLLLGELASRHIKMCNNNLDKFPDWGEPWSPNRFQMFGRSIGQYDSILDRVVSSLANRALNLCEQSVSVVRVDPLVHSFAARHTLRRIKPPDAVSLLGPVENRRLVVGRHTAVTQPLCFGQTSFAEA